MRLASRGGVSFREKQGFRWFRACKRVVQWFRYRSGTAKTVVYVVGCQRSGTSMMHHLLRLDRAAVTYDEISPLSSGDPVEGLRWNPLPEVRARIAADRAPLVVTKPLVESQRLSELLDLFDETRAIWMYRDFRDVVRSNVAFFADGTSHADVAPVLGGDGPSWKAENQDPETVAVVADLYRPDRSPHDAAALFWYLRNRLFLSQDLAGDARVRLCRYEDLVGDPGAVMRGAYRFIGRPYPGDRIVSDVSARSVGRGRDVEISDDIADVCKRLLDRLDGLPRLGRDS